MKSIFIHSPLQFAHICADLIAREHLISYIKFIVDFGCFTRFAFPFNSIQFDPIQFIFYRHLLHHSKNKLLLVITDTTNWMCVLIWIGNWQVWLVNSKQFVRYARFLLFQIGLFKWKQQQQQNSLERFVFVRARNLLENKCVFHEAH